ncbi:hypothetical protein [Streptomyces sp. SP18BB07]|uniref:hypothetical protein n=1 Tax=Streptomyces sp. SP18BB07 TaxID=3002522 RepID=UPI002E7956C4|nr:hypothetical protein [Streptomyces sp. SP18BB07]MEE1764469.1 hypothetical protein [Streptomyces sp. SP18BB07]
MRMTRRPRPAALLAAGLAAAFLGAAAAFGPGTADPHAGTPLPAPLATVTLVTEDAIATAYNDGWTEGRDDLMATGCVEPIPTAPESDDPLVTAYNDGWIDGRHELADSDACTPETLHAGAVAAPLECEHNDAPTDVFRLCLTVAARPGGPEAIAALPQTPGTKQWANALRALDRKQRNA